MTGGFEAVIDANGDVAPPWARYPEIANGSIGWRMGYGEDWLDTWHRWLSQQPRDRAWRLAYLRRHPPAPRTWDRAVASVLAPDDEDDYEDEVAPELAAELEAAGVIGDDVAFAAWLALYGARPQAPWQVPGGQSPGAMVRYGARELDFWARWCASRRASGELARWLNEAPPAPEAWLPLVEAARGGAAPAELRGDVFTRVGALLAAHGQAPAPWVLGEEASSLREDFDDDDASYAEAWSFWVLERFDDVATWRRYLADQGPVPEAWSEALARAFSWLY